MHEKAFFCSERLFISKLFAIADKENYIKSKSLKSNRVVFSHELQMTPAARLRRAVEHLEPHHVRHDVHAPPYPRNLRLLVLRVEMPLVLCRQLGDVEDVDYDGILEEIAAQHALAGLISLAGDDNRRIAGKRPYALKDILLRAWRKVGYQIVVDREVRGDDDEVADSMRLVEIRDERAHEPRLAYARRKREAERAEIAVEVRD